MKIKFMATLEEVVYDKSVLEFVANAQELNTLIELSDTTRLKEFINQLHIVLPKLYSSVTQLPELHPDFEDLNQRFVTEDDYEFQHKRLLTKFGQYDSYEEVLNPINDETGDAITSSISENLCDIYQDIKDFTLLFEVGTHDVMYEALWEVRQSYENFWGQKIVNLIRVLHYLRYSPEEIEENEQLTKENDTFNVNTNDWFISRRQQDLSDEQ